MNPLRRILQSLKSPPSKSWNLIITPDPRRYHGLACIGSASGVYEFRMRLDSNIDMPRYLSENPTFGFASNVRLRMKLPPRPRPIQTEWIRIITKDRKNPTAPTLTVRETLVELLDVFPRYELQSEEGIGEAIGEIEGRLSAVASFEDMDAVSHD